MRMKKTDVERMGKSMKIVVHNKIKQLVLMDMRLNLESDVIKITIIS